MSTAAERLNIAPDVSRREALEHWLGTKLNFDDRSRERLWNALTNFTKKGYQLKVSIESQLERYNRDADLRRTIWRRWITGMAQGLSYSQVIAPYVPPAERMMVSAGEESGRLADGFAAAAHVAKNTRVLKATLRKALSYPAGLVVAACVMLVVIATQFAPVMLDIEPNQVRWPFLSQLLYGLATFVQHFGLWVAAFLVLIIVASLRSLPRWRGSVRRVFDRYIPPYTIYREFQSANFVIALSALVSAGKSVRESLQHMALIATPWMQEHIYQMLGDMAAGISPGRALNTGLLNREVMGLIEDYAKAGTFDEALAHVGHDVVEEAMEALERASGRVLTITIVLVAALIVIAYGGMITLAVQVAASARAG